VEQTSATKKDKGMAKKLIKLKDVKKYPRIHGDECRNQSIPVGESMTKQSFKDDADINNIVGQFLKTGILPQNTSAGQYGDFSEVKDYQSCLNAVIDAQEQFLTLPAKIRDKFGDDPGKLLDFLADSKNYDEAVELGILKAKEVPTVENGGKSNSEAEKPAESKSE
jgi:phage internal scaffolding protein